MALAPIWRPANQRGDRQIIARCDRRSTRQTRDRPLARRGGRISANLRARRREQMPVYALDGMTPKLPPADRYWIGPDAHVIGKVALGEDCGVWFSATLRGDNEWITIGARSNVQESSMLHTDMGFPIEVGEDCTIGHRAILHGCTVGAGSLIGM